MPHGRAFRSTYGYQGVQYHTIILYQFEWREQTKHPLKIYFIIIDRVHNIALLHQQFLFPKVFRHYQVSPILGHVRPSQHSTCRVGVAEFVYEQAATPATVVLLEPDLVRLHVSFGLFQQVVPVGNTMQLADGCVVYR